MSLWRAKYCSPERCSCAMATASESSKYDAVATPHPVKQIRFDGISKTSRGWRSPYTWRMVLPLKKNDNRTSSRLPPTQLITTSSRHIHRDNPRYPSFLVLFSSSRVHVSLFWNEARYPHDIWQGPSWRTQILSRLLSGLPTTSWRSSHIVTRQ
jgi:hypothetical protein